MLSRMNKTANSLVVALAAFCVLSSMVFADERPAHWDEPIAFSHPISDDSASEVAQAPAPVVPANDKSDADEPADKPAAAKPAAAEPVASSDTVARLYHEYRNSSGSSDRRASANGPHLALGVRFMNHWLLSPKKGKPFQHSFIGSINRLDMHNSFLPSPYVRVSAPVGPLAAGLEFSYTRFHISTRDNGGGDGAIDSDAFFLVALAEIPNASIFTPYAQLGAAYAANEFDPIGSWSSDNRREFDLDDSVAFVAALGCSCALTDSILLDLYARYMDYDIDGKYIYRGDSRPDTPFTFTTENVSVGLGLSYVF